jgi:catechol 2,3-dioxygenase-like lactoylglutathione lyase family enzyme
VPVPSVAFKDLCLDAVDRDAALHFWSAVLGGEVDARNEAVARIIDPQLHSLWFNTVPEPKVVKNRVHLDLFAASVQPLLDLGATVYDDQDDFVVLRDPDGNEFCVFPADDHGHTVAEVGLARPFALCVDSAAPEDAARWWHALLGGRIGDGPDGTPRWLHGGAGLGDLILKFVRVHDDRIVKNRWHWDITTDDVDGLVAAGAVVVRPPDADISWTILADPQGNEFCAFAP